MPRSEHSSQPSATPPHNQSSRRIDCYVRDDAPAALTATIENILERLQELHEAEIITDCSVSPWPPTYSDDILTDADSQQTRADVVTEFETWAAEHDYTLTPAFRRQTISPAPLAPENSHERLSVPIVALALYQDETLCGVVPSMETDSGVTYTVMDCLDVLETQGFEELPLTSSTPTAGRLATEERR
jgi:hypothetical protein